jgi:myo-inositol-1(or 4)-monophosphatase
VHRDVRRELDSIRGRAVEVAHEAGALLSSGFRSTPRSRTKRTAADLVTEFDERSEALVRERLHDAFPDIAIVGEEGGGQRGEGAAFYVDPIDGTSNFAHGHPFFCVSIGLWEHGQPLVGVVHAPEMKLTFAAARGAGVTRNGEPCRVSSTDALERALLGSAPHDHPRAYLALDRSTHGIRRCGAAALEISLVADGGYDGFWDVGLAPWDLAAATLFVTEAGGEVTDLEGRAFTVDAPSVLASNGRLHGLLLTALAHARALPPIDPVT